MKKYNTERYKLIIIATFILYSFTTKAQKTVGIGAINNLNSNAVLHLVAPNNDQGFLVPSLTTSQRTTTSFTSKLSSDDNGLLVFDKDEKKFYYWKENAWVALIGTDVGFILSSGTGITINDNKQIENTGDIDGTDDITVGTTAGGDLSGTYPNPVVTNNAITGQKIANDAVDKDKIAPDVAGSGLNQNADGSLEINAGNGLEINADALQLTNTGVTSGTFGEMDRVPQFVVDEKGRITGITELPITVSPSGVAGGELSGTYPDPTINEDVIDSANIKAGAIATENLADGSVTAVKLASQSVNISKIDPGTNNEKSILTTTNSNSLLWFKPGNSQVLVTSSDGQIISEDRSNFETNTLPNGQIFIGNASNQAQGQVVSGDMSMNVGGVVSIQPNAISSAEITDGSVSTNDLGNAIVTTQKLADDAVTLDKLADGPGNQFLTTDGTGAPQYESKSDVLGALAGEGLAENAGMLDVQVDDVSLEIDTDILQVKNGGISTNKIVNDAVSTNKIADDAVDLDKIVNGGADQMLTTDGAGNPQYENKSDIFDALAGEGLAENASMLDVQVDDATLEINADAVQVKDGGITTGKIADVAVTDVKLATNAVSTDKIADNNVSLAKLEDGGADQMLTTDGSGNPQYEDKSIFVSAALPSGNIYIGDGSGVAIAHALAGDATLANDGTLTLKDTGPGAGTYGGGSDVVLSVTLDDQGRVSNVNAGPPPSDERLKKNIAPLQNVLEEVLKLNGYRYQWKNDSLNTKQEIGVIAQEVEQVFPELVRERSDGYKGVNYNGLVPVLLEAIKEQQKMIQQLEEENSTIKSDLEMIKTALEMNKKVPANTEE